MKTQTQTKPTQPHPLSDTEMSGAEMIVQVLADQGVDMVFGYSGGAIPLATAMMSGAILSSS